MGWDRESPYRREFRSLRAETSHVRRGAGLEKLLAQLLRRNYFRVRLNPGAAHPRQSDLIATDGSHQFLIEATWRNQPAEIGDVDSIFQRLHDAAQGLIGVMVSVSGFSIPAIDRVENRRQRPILLVSGQELEQLLDEPGDFRRLLLRKLDAIVAHGKALALPEVTEPFNPGGARVALASSQKQFLFPDGRRMFYLAGSGGFSPLVFTQRIEDIDWVTAGGSGVVLDISVARDSQQSVIDVLEELTARGWASENAHWTLHQAATNWHGFGARSLAAALRSWRVRYRGAAELHHTETLAYYDVCPGGFYTLTADIAADASRRVWRIDLSIQLVGAPADSSPVQHLLDSLNVETPAFFRPRTGKSVQSFSLPHNEWISVIPVAWILEPPEKGVRNLSNRWLSGIVVRNPYAGGLRMNNRRPTPEWWPAALRESDLIVCSLASWHTVGHPHGGYVLKRFEWMWTSDAIVICAVADWLDTPDVAQAKRKAGVVINVKRGLHQVLVPQFRSSSKPGAEPV